VEDRLTVLEEAGDHMALEELVVEVEEEGGPVTT
jgi:hypothetical protein